MSDNSDMKTQEFSKIRTIFWPIHSYENKKFISVSMLMFCILFVYTMVRDLKDVFVQKYATCGGTEMLFALKVWFVMPAAFLFVMLFSMLINKFVL
jgi:AAA family ATP:ADP antiporter